MEEFEPIEKVDLVPDERQEHPEGDIDHLSHASTHLDAQVEIGGKAKVFDETCGHFVLFIVFEGRDFESW